jgi:hypothetical protein
MLEYLHLINVGPAPEMEFALAPRLNLLTGDNGLGKSFLLDCIWWALTRKWPRDVNGRLTSGYRALPRDVKAAASIRFLTPAYLPVIVLVTWAAVSGGGAPACAPRRHCCEALGTHGRP